MNKIKTGDTFKNNEGCEFVVIDYINHSKILIKFQDVYEFEKFTDAKSIRLGNIKNLYFKSILGIGFLGVGSYVANVKRRPTKAYSLFLSMFNRCYSEKYQEKQPTYIGCSVAPEWHNFQNFAKWFDINNLKCGINYQLDKDILVKGNKIYSPDTCCFVPKEINSLLLNNKAKRGKFPLGVWFEKDKFISACHNKGKQIYIGSFDTPEEAFEAYKIYKENLIVEIAKEYFEQDLISFDVYKALLNYKIEITD